MPTLATQVVRWQRTHGRNDLPWQNTRDPYRVWLSEIMLQQTQVATVRDYFARFLARCPDVASLAAASQDEVMALWSGLGYYSRARNLHQCAKDVVALHGGAFPASAALLQTLPGIGRSTAGAIASLCFGERVAILDGNVKRVLTRVLAFDADLSQAANERALWAQATQRLPTQDLPQSMPRYTQGMMDLGATVCLASKPRCDVCPLATQCSGLASGEPMRFPVKTRKLQRSAQSLWLLWARCESGESPRPQVPGRAGGPSSAVWLSKRPAPGVWAGLYCLPLFDSRDALVQLLAQVLSATQQRSLTDLPAVNHVLTHKDLYLHPVVLTLSAPLALPLAGGWVDAADWASLGLPAPIRKLLNDFEP